MIFRLPGIVSPEIVELRCSIHVDGRGDSPGKIRCRLDAKLDHATNEPTAHDLETRNYSEVGPVWRLDGLNDKAESPKVVAESLEPEHHETGVGPL